MSGLAKRVVTASVLAALVLGTLFALPPVAAVILFSAVLFIGGWEWSAFVSRRRWLRIAYVAGAVALGGALLGWRVVSGSWALVMYAAVLWWLLVIAWLTLPEKRIGALLAGLAGYAGLLPAWSALLILLQSGEGDWLFVWLICVVAAADIGAYFTGKAIGRRKLAPKLSPGKTVEGVCGGLLAAAAAAAVGAWLLGLPPLLWLAGGPLVAAVSVAGDLTVSAFKRASGIKDTGWILPGHGGIMDRADSLVAAAPWFVVLLGLTGAMAL